MSRLLPFLLALALAHVAVSIAVAPRTICQERCPDDGPDGRCSPVCLSCVPTGHAASPAPLSVWSAPDLQHEAIVVSAAEMPGDPEPHDIFHVPKPPLA